MAAEDVSRRGVIEGAAVIGAAAVVAPQVSNAIYEKDQKGFLAPTTYSKFYAGKAPNVAPVVSFPQIHCMITYLSRDLLLHVQKTLKFCVGL